MDKKDAEIELLDRLIEGLKGITNGNANKDGKQGDKPKNEIIGIPLTPFTPYNPDDYKTKKTG